MNAGRPTRLRRVLSALEAATGLGGLVRRAGSIRGPLSWGATTGTALGLVILAQVVTGIGLAFYYAPSTGSATKAATLPELWNWIARASCSAQRSAHSASVREP